MSKQFAQDLGDMPVQTSDKVAEKPKKKRSVEDKVGRVKYHEVVTKKILAQNERILNELRWVRHRLDRLGEAEYSQSDLEGFAVADEVDREIIQRIRRLALAAPYLRM